MIGSVPPGDTGVSLHFVRVEIAGSISRRLVYADGVDLGNLDAAIPIGTTCRLCERRASR